MKQADVIVTPQVTIRSQFYRSIQLGGASMLWRMPKSTEKVLMVCFSGSMASTEVNLESSLPGFIVAPFNPAAEKLFFKADSILRFQGETLTDSIGLDLSTMKKSSADNEEEKSLHYAPLTEIEKPTSFINLIEACIEKTKRGEVEKIVPSRYEDIPVSEGFDAVALFEKMCAAHPNAFVSLTSAPETGTWLGASPELLVQTDSSDHFKTIALAGTQKREPGIDLRQVAWTQKEIEEQALVSRYIINCFKKIRVREYKESGPFTVEAGNLLHLRTEYEVNMQEVNFPQLGSVMLKLLHPTSAVCGMPLEPALQFLQQHEGYSRALYTGYLGPVNFFGTSTMFVNLRCMQLFPKHVRLYAGAGVTRDSIAAREVDEITLKLKSLSQLLRD